jgi:hypothetical protein
MTELDIEIDDGLRHRAVEAAERCVRLYGCRLTPSQVNGLRQLGRLQPKEVSNYAAKQKLRAQKRSQDPTDRHAQEAGFWDQLWKLCNSGKAKDLDWTLKSALAEANVAKGEQDQWINDRYPPFFQALCIHYLYLRGQQSPHEEDHDD